MSNVLSTAQIIDQEVELLPGRTTLAAIIVLPGGGAVQEPGLDDPVGEPAGYAFGSAIGAVPAPGLTPVH